MREFLRRQVQRAANLGALTLALGAGTGHVAGCIYPDYCIKLGISGSQTCLRFSNATGTTAEGEVVMLDSEFDPVEGCECMRDGEVATLIAEDADAPGYAELYDELETAARQACLERALELGMVDSNCLGADVEGSIRVVVGSTCTAGCVYSNPPPNGRCPECVVDDENASGETGASSGEGEDSESGGEDPPARAQLFYGGGQ